MHHEGNAPAVWMVKFGCFISSPIVFSLFFYWQFLFIITDDKLYGTLERSVPDVCDSENVNFVLRVFFLFPFVSDSCSIKFI